MENDTDLYADKSDLAEVVFPEDEYPHVTDSPESVTGEWDDLCWNPPSNYAFWQL